LVALGIESVQRLTDFYKRTAAPLRHTGRAQSSLETLIMKKPVINKSTPVLFVEAIEPSLPFWEECLGFERQAEVPDEGRLGFVILTKGAVEVMYQTIALMKKDVAQQAHDFHGDKSFLFVEVADLSAVAKALERYAIVMPRRETSYGSSEIGYLEPGGHFITFAQFQPRQT
jgi:hypothetical protein